MHADDAAAAEQGQDPRHLAAERSEGAPADLAERLVDAGDGRPLGKHPHDPAQGQQTAERDHERGHAHVRDDEALERADGDAQPDAEREGDDPHPLAAHLGEADDVGQEVGHEDGVDHGQTPTWSPPRGRCCGTR